jgi:hypothetical protein
VVPVFLLLRLMLPLIFSSTRLIRQFMPALINLQLLLPIFYFMFPTLPRDLQTLL